MIETIKCILEGGAQLPTRGSLKAACWDIYAAEEAELRPYQAHKLTTGIRTELPENHVLLLFPRSGFSFKNQILLPNSVGVIDEDYRGLSALTAIWMPDPVSVIATRVRMPKQDPYLVATDTMPAPVVELSYREDAVFKVKKGDRITQAMLLEYKEQNWEIHDALSPTARGDGGFGSTGLRAADTGGLPPCQIGG